MDEILSQVGEDVYGGGPNWYELIYRIPRWTTLDRATAVFSGCTETKHPWQRLRPLSDGMLDD